MRDAEARSGEERVGEGEKEGEEKEEKVKAA
jgi:hypothetical protein